MKEIIFLSFGNNSNYILTHFLNLNDEILKDKHNPLNLNHNCIYNENFRPRILIFDYSSNIKKYYNINEKINQEYLETLSEKHSNEKCQIYPTYSSQNNFLSMMSELNETNTEVEEDNEQEEEEEEDIINSNNYFNYNKKKQKNKNQINEEKKPKKEMSEKLENLLSLDDNELYEYFNFNNSIKNWNDYLQIKLNSNCLNEIKQIDIDERMPTSYIRGKDFLKTGYNNMNYYENFEDSFRKKLEECDCLSCLNFNIDINSLWGGIGCYMIENIHDMINKIPKVLNSYDYNSLFYLPDEKGEININSCLFDIEKFVNYIWALSDLQDIEGANILMNINYLNETKNIIKDYYGYEPQSILINNNKNNLDTINLENVDPVYKYYYSSLSALQLQTFYIPLRSTLYGKNNYIQNLSITSNESTINFMESDLIFNLDMTKNNNINLETSGTLYNFSRNIKNPQFKWEKLFSKSIYLNNYNSSILIGNDDKYKLMNEKIPDYLRKMSKIVFNLDENYPLPISFPRKFYKNVKFEGGVYEYKNQIPLYINNRPYFDFSLKTLSNLKKDYKTYELSAKKLLGKIDKEKEFDYHDKIESIMNLNYVYQDLAEEKLNEFNDEESDEEPDY